MIFSSNSSYRRGMALDLQIQFSAPKLLFNNNLNELEQANFDRVVKTLRERLIDMGVRVWTKSIENAHVLSFHPSKNIPLSGGYTATLAIKELSKIDISKRVDVDFKNYRNNGQSLQLYTNSHSIVLYDKITDMKKSANRAIDKDQTAQQMTIFDALKKKQPRLEVLRLEIRLSKKAKMNEMLEKVGYKTNPTFKNIFKKNLCKKIVNHYWNEYFSDNLFLFSMNNNSQKILQTIFSKYKPIKIKQAIYLVGIIALCKDDEGIRGLKTVIGSYLPDTNWETIKREIGKVKEKILSEN